MTVPTCPNSKSVNDSHRVETCSIVVKCPTFGFHYFGNNNNFGFRYDLVPTLQPHRRRGPALVVQRWEWNDIRSLAKPLCFVTRSAIAIAFVIAGGHGHHKQRNLCWLQFKKPSKIGTFILYGVLLCVVGRSGRCLCDFGWCVIFLEALLEMLLVR